MGATAPTQRPRRLRRDDAPSGIARWRQSWLLALRLAGRDIRTHRGRSLLILVLVAAPAVLIAALATAVRTDDVSTRESLPVRLGAAQAEVSPAGTTGPIKQLADGTDYVTTDGPYLSVGGRRADEEWTREQVATLTGARVLTVATPTVFRVEGDRLTRLRALAAPAPDLPATGLVTLTSGRWPQAADEALVTERGQRKGVPAAGGGVTVRDAESGTERTVRVVGTATGRDREFRPYDLITLPATGRTAGSGQGSWLLLRDRPVSWAEVQDWNRSGLLVVSRAVVEHPPPESQQPADLVALTRDNSRDNAGIVVAIALGLLLETSLLAGPAFAVSAVRRRRSVAQLAANGADRDQLRHLVLAEALLLGAGAASAGAALGALGGWAALQLHNRLDPYASSGPLDLPWLSLVALVAAATVAALVAAAVPARGASQIAIADVLAGRERSRPVRTAGRSMGVGLVVVAAAGLMATTTLGQPGSNLWLLAIAAAVLVIGTLVLVPTVLAGLGRVAGPLPLTLRHPLRDTARQRARSASAVAAVAATLAVLTILSVANASDDAQNRASYTTDRIAGHGYVSGQGQGIPIDTVAEIRHQHPEWQIIPRGSLGTFGDPELGREPEIVAAVPAGCTPEQSLGIGELNESDSQRCVRLGTGGNLGQIDTVPASLVAGSGAPAAVRTALASGALVTSDQAMGGGRTRLAVGAVSGREDDRLLRVRTVRSLVVTPAELRAAARIAPPPPPSSSSYARSAAGLMTAEAAAGLGLPVEVGSLEIVDPAGPITRSDQNALNDRIVEPMDVERGYQSPVQVLLLGMLGVAGALVLVAALVATALAQAESRADLATLAALGGPPGLRRRLAAGQALVVAGLGSVLGFAAGLLPGCAFGLAFTTDGSADPATGASADGVVVVPWPSLLAVLVGVPLLAALLAAVAVRRTPPLTRRLT